MAIDVETIKQSARRYDADVSRLLPVEKALLFGSYVKGGAAKTSDVDVCFFLKDYKGKQRAEIIAELLGIGGAYRTVPFEPIVFETAEIQNGNPFVREILAIGIDLL